MEILLEISIDQVAIIINIPVIHYYKKLTLIQSRCLVN